MAGKTDNGQCPNHWLVTADLSTFQANATGPGAVEPNDITQNDCDSDEEEDLGQSEDEERHSVEAEDSENQVMSEGTPERHTTEAEQHVEEGDESEQVGSEDSSDDEVEDESEDGSED
jgi:hypothetical protein